MDKNRVSIKLHFRCPAMMSETKVAEASMDVHAYGETFEEAVDEGRKFVNALFGLKPKQKDWRSPSLESAIVIPKNTYAGN